MSCYNKIDLFYYILCNFNKYKLDKDDINKLIGLKFCKSCISELESLDLTKQEIDYINKKDWDDFIEKYPRQLYQCECIKCICGENKVFDILYDLFDIKEVNPICMISCSKCIKLKIPIDIKKNTSKRSHTEIENVNVNKNIITKKIYDIEENKIVKILDNFNTNQLLCS